MHDLRIARRQIFRCISICLLVVCTTVVGYSQTPPSSYATSFTSAENPLSEAGHWVNGKTNGLVWQDVRVNSGTAIGTQSGIPGVFDDSTALLSGVWSPDQMAQATVRTVNQNSSIFEEVELRLRSTITANINTGYEINFRCTSDGSQYTEIVRWNGLLGSFSYISRGVQGPGLRNGDVVKATIIGNTITVYINGTQVNQGVDQNPNPYTGGNPGMGFYLEGGSSATNADFGFTNFMASDIGSTNWGSSAQPNTKILRGDFNGDNKNDILWQNADGSVAIWLMDGLNVIGSAGLLGANTGWAVQQVADFNGDGNSDILWLKADGSVAMWLMNGTSVAASAGLLGPDTNWSVKKIGDFDGDLKSDILWQNIDGSTAIWLMDGTTVKNSGGLLGAASGWSVQEVGDFDHDGKTDIVWQHLNGSSAIWLMNGVGPKGSCGLIGAGTGWSVAFVGDFNGDTNADIVWKHTDGSYAMWLMSGTSVIGGGGLIGPATNWNVKRVGDFNGDGKDDLIWQNADGRVAVLLMNGISPLATGDLLLAGNSWSVNRLGDFNGDGTSDIIFVHPDGSVAMWLMNGTTLTAGGNLLGAGSGWSPAP